jgi:glycerol-3-phosphate dehydrogenase
MTGSADHNVDLLVIGGGINGAGIARDAAGRGLKALLCEKGDLGSATSSASSKLIHGGLRYLEHFEIRLVREALAEREVLLRIAPHIARPLRFVLPLDSSLRPAWMIAIGLFLYDHLARRSRLAASRRLDLRTAPEGQPLKAELTRGFSYSDGWVDDSRLVVLNAMDAAARGAVVMPRWACQTVLRQDNRFIAQLVASDRRKVSVSARAVVNAAGPWAGRMLNHITGEPDPLRLVKGSHIVVPRLYDGDHAYILQNDDKRIVFTIPYEGRFTVVGTTDVAYSGDAEHVSIAPEEISYLCAAVNRWFRQPLQPESIVSTYAGVRPLIDDEQSDPSAVTRDYVFDLRGGGDEPVLLSVFGGKLTTYRPLAETVLSKLKPFFPQMPGAWTGAASLPGGDIPGADIDAFETAFVRDHPWLAPDIARRYARAYGDRVAIVLDGARSAADLGRHFGAGLYQREVEYLIDHEWAETVEDILWRRTKIGLHIAPDGVAALERWLAQRSPDREAAASLKDKRA